MTASKSVEESNNNKTVMEKAGVEPFTVEKASMDVFTPEKDIRREQHQALLAQLGSRWFTVEPLVIIYMAAYMSLIPLLQQYTHSRLVEEYNITEQSDNPNITDREQCLARAEEGEEPSEKEREFTNHMAQWNMAFMCMGIAPTLLTLLIVGAFSDKRGRRYGLIPQIGAGIITGLCITVVVAFKLPIALLILGNLIVGLTGSMPAVLMACYSYIADINPPEKRFMRIVVIEIGIGLGTLIANLVFGALIKASGFLVPALIFTAIQAVCFIYCVFFLHETILVEEGAPLCDMSSLKDLPKLWFSRKDDVERSKVIWLCGIIMLMNTMLGEGPQLIMTLIFVDPPLCWDSLVLGIFNGIYYVIKAFGSLMFMKTLFDRAPPEAMLMLGTVSAMLFCLILGVAKVTWLAFIGGVSGCASMLVGPISRSIASAKVPDNLQGSLFSGLGWAQMLAMLVSQPIFNILYNRLGTGNGGKLFLFTLPLFLITITLIVVLYFVERKPRGRADTINGVTVADTDTLDDK